MERAVDVNRKAWLPPRLLIRGAWAVHRAIYRMSEGRRGLRPATPAQWGTMRLHTRGRRTGADRVAILGYLEDGPNLVTTAMNGWGDPEPAWWLNLQADPDASVDLIGGSRRVRGRIANPEERRRLWSRWAHYEKNIDRYAARRSRETAVVILEPAP
jgi:F420H(2)-dependent quinone reductase